MAETQRVEARREGSEKDKAIRVLELVKAALLKRLDAAEARNEKQVRRAWIAAVIEAVSRPKARLF